MEHTKQLAKLALDEKGDRVIRIQFPYDVDLLYKVRSLPNRKYHPDDRCWSAPVHISIVESLKSWGFSLDRHLQKMITKKNEKRTKIKIKGIPGLRGTLRPFQEEGVAFIEANNGRALIADEMGLGKTIQAIAWLQLRKKYRPVIIVVPASLKLNWVKELLTWMNHPSVELLIGTSPWIPTADIIIINYDILDHWIPSLASIEPQVLITDECHYFKSNSAKRTKAIKRLAKQIPYVIALSGTPIENRPIEIYNAVKIIAPDLFPDYWRFVHRYCAAKHTGFGWDFSGASHTDELHEKLTDTIMIRRTKKDVLSDLPDKVRSFIPTQICNETVYRGAEADFLTFIRKTKGEDAADKAANAITLTSIEGLKQLAVEGKIDAAINWIEDFLESGQKLVVFAIHKTIIDSLMKKFGKIAVKIDGSVPPDTRQEVVEKFQNDSKIKLFVGNIKAAGVGITLTASSNVVFLELPWTPGALSQAEDRCHRIGQKDCVNIWYLLATGTIEESIAELLDKKRKVLDAVLDGIETSQQSLLSELIKQYTK